MRATRSGAVYNTMSGSSSTSDIPNAAPDAATTLFIQHPYDLKINPWTIEGGKLYRKATEPLNNN